MPRNSTDIYLSTGSDSSSGRASASEAVGRGLKSWPRYSKAIKMYVLAARITIKGRDRKIKSKYL